jgi:hypothetical protein
VHEADPYPSGTSKKLVEVCPFARATERFECGLSPIAYDVVGSQGVPAWVARPVLRRAEGGWSTIRYSKDLPVAKPRYAMQNATVKDRDEYAS